jgi:hypothetical protein
MLPSRTLHVKLAHGDVQRVGAHGQAQLGQCILQLIHIHTPVAIDVHLLQLEDGSGSSEQGKSSLLTTLA